MYNKIYRMLATNFYMVKMDDYIVTDEKEFKRRLINGQIDEIQKEIFETKCFRSKEFIERIVDLHSCFFKFIPEEYQNDYNYIMGLLKLNPNIYKYLPFKSDDHILKEVLSKNPFMLKYAPDNIKDDEKYVILTKNKENKVIYYASDRLKDKYGCYSSVSILESSAICR